MVINELMYDPISGNDDDQYMELYNRGTNPVNLGRLATHRRRHLRLFQRHAWRPTVTVVARNMTNLFAKHPNLNSGEHGGELQRQAVAQRRTI